MNGRKFKGLRTSPEHYYSYYIIITLLIAFLVIGLLSLLTVGLGVSAHAPEAPCDAPQHAPRKSPPPRIQAARLVGFQAAWCSGGSDSGPFSQPPGARPAGGAVHGRLEGGALQAWLLPAPGVPRALGPGTGRAASATPRQSLMVPLPMPKAESPGWRGRGWPCCALTWLSSPGSDAGN